MFNLGHSSFMARMLQNEKVCYFYLDGFSVNFWVSHPSPFCKFADWNDGYKNRENILHLKSWPILI